MHRSPALDMSHQRALRAVEMILAVRKEDDKMLRDRPQDTGKEIEQAYENRSGVEDDRDLETFVRNELFY